MTAAKLRFRGLGVPLRVVLVEPEIPPNTGSIARTCAATGCTLHLVGRLGFRTDEHAVKRAGLDYWRLVSVHEHETFDRFLEELAPPSVFLYTSKGERCYTSAPCAGGSALVFGRETSGLPDGLTARYPGACYGIPTLPAIRSLNLSNAVSIVVYDALRRLGAFDGTFSAP